MSRAFASLAALIAVLVLGGCASGTPTGGSPSVSAEASAAASAERMATLSAAERELSRIGSELEALSMPSDEDFSRAEDALF